MDIGTLTITLGVDASGVLQAQSAVAKLAIAAETAEKKGQSAMVGFADSVKKASMQLRSFGWLATTVFTAPILLASKSMIQMGMDFEFQMAKIEGLVGMNKETVKEWSDELLRMAPATATSLKSLADTLYYTSSAGFKNAEALRITELSAKAAATGLGEAKDIANFLTSSMNAYRESNLKAADALDILTAAVREGKGEPADFAKAIGTIVPISAELGVSLDQVAGALSAMTLVTSSTANSATYLRNILMKMIKPSAETEALLREMGTSGEELRKTLGQEGLMPTLMKVRDLTAKYGETMGKIFPNIRALLGVLNLTGENMEYNRTVMEQVTRSAGDFQKAFDISSQTLRFRWNAALEQGKALMTKMGETLAKIVLPAFENLMNRLSKLVDWFNNLNDGTQRFIIHVAGLVAALGPLALVISTIGMTANTLIKTFDKLSILLAKPTFNVWAAGALAIAGVVFWLKEQHNKAIEAQKATSKLNDSLVAVSNTMKTLSSLGKEDYASMTLTQLSQANAAAWESAKKATEEFERLEALRKKNPGHNKAYDVLEDPVVVAFENAKRVYQETNQAIDTYLKKTSSLQGTSISMFESIDNPAIREAMQNMERQEKIINTTAEAFRKIGKEYEKNDKLAEVYNKTLEDLGAIGLKDAGKYIELVDQRLKNLGISEKESTKDMEVAVKVLDTFQNKLATIELLFQATGDATEYNKNKLKLYESTVGNIVEKFGELTAVMNSLPGGFSLATGILVMMLQKVKELSAAVEQDSMAKSFTDLASSVEAAEKKIAEKEEVLGNSFNEGRALVNLYAEALESAFNNLNIKDPEVLKFIEELKKKMEEAGLSTMDFIDKFEMIVQSVQAFIGGIESIVKASESKELKYLEDMADAKKWSQEKLAKEREKIEEKYAKKMKALAIAEALINGAVSITNILRNVPAGPLNPLTWVAIGLTAATTAAQVAAIASTPLAEGGIVPPGYPNDTFHARLTSNEAVIPLDKLNSIMPQRSMYGKVKFQIEGRTLVGILEEETNYANSF